jgi:hypothetical protein
VKAPRRLLVEGANDFERALLRSARTDKPTREARARQFAVLGLAGTTAGAAHGAATAVAALSKVGVVKWAVVVVLVGSAAVGVQHILTRREVGPHAASVVVPLASAGAAAPAATSTTAVTETAPTAATAPTDVTRVELPAASPPPRAIHALPAIAIPTPSAAESAAPTPASRTAARLAEETATIDAARKALRSGSAVDALRILDAHARDYPGGALLPEASALRVEALLASGDRASAETVARALLATYPATPAARRVRAMLNW